MTRRVAVFFETFDRREIALDNLDDIGHGDFGRVPREQIAAAGTLLAGDETAALELDQEPPQVVFRDTLGSRDFLDALRLNVRITLREGDQGLQTVVNADTEFHRLTGLFVA